MEEKILKLIKNHHDIDTRIVIDAFSIAWDVPKQKISGYLSSLKRNGKIKIITIEEGEFSTAMYK